MNQEVKIMFAKGHGSKFTKTENSVQADLEQEEFIAQLPNEILCKIFQYLNTESLLSCACVCKRWELIVNNNSFWKKYHKQFIKGSQDSENKKSEKILKDEIYSEFQKQKKKLVSCYTGKMFNPSLLNSHLGALGAKFQMSIVLEDGEERTIATDHCSSVGSSCVVIHGIPEESVDIENIADVKVVASTQILKEISEEGRSQESICQKSLIFKEKIGSNIIRRYTMGPINARNDKIAAFFTISGNLLIGLWKDSSNLAFVYLSLQGHLLVEKGLLSNLQRIYSPPSGELTGLESIGMFAITCKLSNDSSICEFDQTFNSVLPHNSSIDSFITFKSSAQSGYDGLSNRTYFNWKAKTEEGLLKNLSVFTITIKNCFFRNIIWSASSFVKLEKLSRRDVFKLFYQSNVGKVEIVFIYNRNRFRRKVYKIHDVKMSFDLRKIHSQNKRN